RAYAENLHPEIEPGVSKAPSRAVPRPEPDAMAWYKWSMDGHFLGDDPSNWRTRPDDDGDRSARWIERKKYARRPKESVAQGSIKFDGWQWVCPRCERRVRMVYAPLARPKLEHDLEALEERREQE